MPRVPLGSISSNLVDNKELKPYARGIIKGKTTAGQTPTQIAADLKLSRRTIRTTLARDTERDQGTTKPRSGRPKSFTLRDERTILRMARIDPKQTYRDLIEKSGVDCSRKTVYRILRDAGIINWLVKKRPLLRPQDVKARLRWAKKYKDWTYNDWVKVIWSDECSVERGSGKRREWVFRTPAQKWDKNMIQATPKGKDVRVMVWTAFWGGGTSDLYPLERDFESKKMGYSANSYLDVLEQNLVDWYKPGQIFMQDNATIHTAYKVRLWFEEHGVEVMEWPPYSPDLNPIEHLWYRLKELVYTHHPELMEVGGNDDKVRTELTKAMLDVWPKVEDELKHDLIDSMTTRINAVLDAEGWYTRF